MRHTNYYMTKFKIGYENQIADALFDSYYLEYERSILERTFETQVMPKNLFLMSFFGNPTVESEYDTELKKVFEDYGIFFGNSDSKKLLPIDNQFAHLIDSIEVDENSFFENLVYKSNELPTLTFNVTDDVMRTFGNFYKRYLGLWLNDNLSLKTTFTKLTTSYVKEMVYNYGFEEFDLIHSLARKFQEKISLLSKDVQDHFYDDIREDTKAIEKRHDEFCDKYDSDIKEYQSDSGLHGFLIDVIRLDYKGLSGIKAVEKELVSSLFGDLKSRFPQVYTADGVDAKVAGNNKDFFQKVSEAKSYKDLKTAYEKHERAQKYESTMGLLENIIKIFDDGYKWGNGDKYVDFFNSLRSYKQPDREEPVDKPVVTPSEEKRPTPYLNLSITQYAYDSETSVVKTRPVVTYTFYNLRPNFDLKKLPKNLLQIGDGFSYENTTKSEKYEFNFSGVSMYDHASDKDVLTLGNCLKIPTLTSA